MGTEINIAEEKRNADNLTQNPIAEKSNLLVNLAFNFNFFLFLTELKQICRYI